jgi:hemerythrin-like domain-containing protein
MSSRIHETATRERRTFLRAAVSSAAFAFMGGCASTKPAGASMFEPVAEGNDEAEVTPGEDLMQEHGVLERILLIYDEGARRIENGQKLELPVIASAAGLVRRFVEDYHEQLEEEFVFPKLRAAQRQAELVAVLSRQHQRGRQLTDAIVELSAGKPTPELVPLLRSFTRMYRPHAAREETVLLPAFRQVVGGKQYLELGGWFEARERQLFGERGFENAVIEVSRLEQALGIADLASFTPS